MPVDTMRRGLRRSIVGELAAFLVLDEAITPVLFLVALSLHLKGCLR